MSFYRKAQAHWTRLKGFRCPYMAIMDAAEAGKGIHLSAAEVAYMAEDAALATTASNHYEESTQNLSIVDEWTLNRHG